jgi:hypothetical protein
VAIGQLLDSLRREGERRRQHRLSGPPFEPEDILEVEPMIGIEQRAKAQTGRHVIAGQKEQRRLPRRKKPSRRRPGGVLADTVLGKEWVENVRLHMR